MKRKQNTLLRLQLALLSIIAVAAPCLYATCVTQISCNDWYQGATVWCSGSNPQEGSDYGANAYWLGGGGPCGELFIRGVDTGNTCGQGIATSCT